MAEQKKDQHNALGPNSRIEIYEKFPQENEALIQD